MRRDMSLNAAGLVRYLYGLPVAIALLALYLAVRGGGLPGGNGPFLLWAALGGLMQLIGTNLLLMAFSHRNYVVGTAYATTEAVQGAILAMILLGEVLSVVTWAGIAIGVIGVMVLSTGGQRLRLSDLTQPAALCGLGAGLMFALTAVFVKRATLELSGSDVVLHALATLVVVQACQTGMQGSYLIARERDQLALVFRNWRVASQVGLLTALGSACWFTGFALAPVALVRAVGQVEVVFTLAFGRFYLNEPLKRSEAAGLVLVGLGVVIALLGSFRHGL